MSKKEKIEDMTWAYAGPIAGELGLIPVDAEYVKENDGYQLIVTIDKEGGVGINDCEAMSRALDPILDEKDYIPDVYTLIVTSPGLGRVLRRPRDFDFALDKEVEIHTYKAIDKVKEFRGTLTAFDKDSVRILSPDGEKEFARKDIAKISLAFDF